MCNKYTPGKIMSIAEGKCPRCRSGKMFRFSGWRLNKFTIMNEDCPVCGLHFEIEPGFFWGAMYVSYALTTGMLIVLGGLTLIIGHNPDFWVYILVVCGSVILTSPYTYRYSRILMMHLFSHVRFEEKLANK